MVGHWWTLHWIRYSRASTKVTVPRTTAGAIPLGGFRVALDMAFGALSKYDFCFVGMGFPEVGSLGMEANGVGSKRILESRRSGEVSPPDSGAVLVEESQQAS